MQLAAAKLRPVGPVKAPGLDLVRAMAIAAVLVCHSLVILPTESARLGAVLSYLGETGVNLFFALSGFLIGRIALRRVHGIRDAGHFWMRRWFRTLPLGFAVALVLALLLHTSALNLLSVLTFSRGLVRDALDSSFLPHYWSLMIEEWAYLLLPLLLIAAGPGRRRLAWVGGAWLGLVAFHIAAAAVLHLNYWQQATLTWMRLDAILAGVLMAGLEPMLQGRGICSTRGGGGLPA